LRNLPLIFLKLLCLVVIELFKLKDPMWLMLKAYLFPVQIGLPLAKASKICMIYGYSTFPTIGNAVNVQSLGIGKPDIYRRKD
jgi:hypothetical protein